MSCSNCDTDRGAQRRETGRQEPLFIRQQFPSDLRLSPLSSRTHYILSWIEYVMGDVEAWLSQRLAKMGLEDEAMARSDPFLSLSLFALSLFFCLSVSLSASLCLFLPLSISPPFACLPPPTSVCLCHPSFPLLAFLLLSAVCRDRLAFPLATCSYFLSVAQDEDASREDRAADLNELLEEALVCRLSEMCPSLASRSSCVPFLSYLALNSTRFKPKSQGKAASDLVEELLLRCENKEEEAAAAAASGQASACSQKIIVLSRSPPPIFLNTTPSYYARLNDCVPFSVQSTYRPVARRARRPTHKDPGGNKCGGAGYEGCVSPLSHDPFCIFCAACSWTKPSTGPSKVRANYGTRRSEDWWQSTA